MNLNDELFKKMIVQAEQEYPRECCGMILGPSLAPETLTRVRPCVNVQDKYHALDPEVFPRTAETAYFIDPKELLSIQKEAREANEAIRVIYHSHIDCGAYFSAEDKKIATVDGEPAYPGVQYLVLSARQGKVDDMRLFKWDDNKKDFIA